MDTAQWPQEIVVKPIEEIIVPNSNSSIPSTSKPSNNNSNGGGSTNNPSLERRVLVRPTKDQAQALNCPRCNSTNTKFCYYNNYSLTQPRYFCKTCRRYWTEGGSLRNIPVGGGSRKNKRSSSSSSSSTSSKMINGGKPPPPLVVPPPPPGHLQVVPPALPAVLQMASLTTSHHHTQGQNPNNYHHRSLHHHHLQHGQDLNLGFPTSDNDFKTISELIQVPNFDGEDGNNRDHVVKNTNSNSPASTTTTSTVTTGINTGTTLSAHQQLSALELLTRGSGGGLMNSFMPMPIHPDPNAGTGAGVFSSSGLIPVPEFKLPSLSFSLDGIGNNGSYGGSLHHQENGSNGGRLLFPFEDLKHVTTSSTTTANHDHDHGGINDGDDQNRDPNGDSGGYWNGMLGGASW